MVRYELCIGTDAAGGGELFDSLADAKAAGWERIGPVDAHEARALPLEAFFTDHEVRAEGTAPTLLFDTRNEYAAA